MVQFKEAISKLITHSDSARNNSFQALKRAVRGEYDRAEEALITAKQELVEAHSMHTNLIKIKPIKETSEISLLLTHVQDHLMTSIMAKDLIGEIVKNQKEIASLKKLIVNK